MYADDNNNADTNVEAILAAMNGYMQNLNPWPLRYQCSLCQLS